MPIESYFDQKEPPENAEIWRFMSFRKFEDLMGTEELYFCRADLFHQDDEECIPDEEYLRLIMGSDRFILKDETELNHQIGSLSQMREMYYVNCWHLFRKEHPAMWEAFGKDGVAICSRYNLLKAVLNGMMERGHLGLVQYGDKHLRQGMRMNVLQFITTKRERFASECEVRGFIEYRDPFAGHNLHFDANSFPHRRPLPENEPYRHHWVHDHKRRRIDLKALITGVVLSPHASEEAAAMTRQWMQTRGLSAHVRWSDLKNPQ